MSLNPQKHPSETPTPTQCAAPSLLRLTTENTHSLHEKPVKLPFKHSFLSVRNNPTIDTTKQNFKSKFVLGVILVKNQDNRNTGLEQLSASHCIQFPAAGNFCSSVRSRQ